MMENYLRDLCGLDGVSGNENSVRDYILSVTGRVDCIADTDSLGNIIIFKKGRRHPSNKIMLCAHMDEVGFIVTGINPDGFILLSAVGGIADSAVFGRRIRFAGGDKNSYGPLGVIGGKPVHHIRDTDEKDKQPPLNTLYADIGATSGQDAEKYVNIGGYASFVSEYNARFGDNLIKAKALDDRAGCAVMLDMLMSELEYDMLFVFTVQEETGARGAVTAAFQTRAQFAVILEATTACDVAGVTGASRVCRLGHGTVVPFMDSGASYDRELYNLAFDTAAHINVKIQTKTQIAGGNDGGAIHKAAGGVRTVCLALPCRYLHTPNCVINRADLAQMRILAEKLTERIAEL